MKVLKVMSINLAEVLKQPTIDEPGKPASFPSRIVALLPAAMTHLQITNEYVHIFYTEDETGGRA